MASCENCSVVYTPGKNAKGKYCSLSCQAASRSALVVNTYLADQSYENLYNAGHQIRRGIRAYLIRQAGCKCVECGWGATNEFANTGLPPLEVDHKDGDWKNSKVSNLRVICPNCHSLTATYRGRNKGNSREYRRANSSRE